MRNGRKPEFIYTPVEVAENAEGQKRGTAKLLAVNLGADYCAEHEWGIKKLKEMFGISDKISDYGLKRRKVSKLPKEFCWIGNNKRGGFVVSNWYARQPAEFLVDPEFAGEGLRTAWAENGFGAVSDNAADIEKLKEIHDAFLKKNVILCFSKTLFPAFENPGLCLVIADRLNKSILDEWKKADKEAHQLRKDVEKTGIEAWAEGKGKIPMSKAQQRQEDGSIQYWLNPYRTCRCGKEVSAAGLAWYNHMMAHVRRGEATVTRTPLSVSLYSNVTFEWVKGAPCRASKSR